MDLVYTYIDKYGMNVVGMFPLKKNTPAVSYRGGGGGGGRYIENWSIPPDTAYCSTTNTSVYYTEHKPKNKKRGRPENKAIENQQDSVNILEWPHTMCVKETLKIPLENFLAMPLVWF